MVISNVYVISGKFVVNIGPLLEVVSYTADSKKDDDTPPLWTELSEVC